MKKLRTHYDNLKISRRATGVEIKRAYRHLASIHHPDKNGSSPASINAMQCINKAYEVLSDPVARAAHDQWIEATEYACGLDCPPTAPEARPSHGQSWTGFKDHFKNPMPPPAFDPSQFPPKNWNPEHFPAFSRYALAMRRLLEYEISEYGEQMTLDVLYRAFLMDKRLGNLKHATRVSARDSLIRSFAHKERPPLKALQWLRRFQFLDQSIRKAVIFGAVCLALLIFVQLM